LLDGLPVPEIAANHLDAAGFERFRTFGWPGKSPYLNVFRQQAFH